MASNGLSLDLIFTKGMNFLRLKNAIILQWRQPWKVEHLFAFIVFQNF